MLTRLDLAEKMSQAIPKLIHNAETSTILHEQSHAEKYLEKTFDVLQKMLVNGGQEVALRMSKEHIMRDCLGKVV